MTSFRNYKKNLARQSAKEAAKPSAAPYPNIITQVNKEDEKKNQTFSSVVFKCCSLLWRCVPFRKKNFVPIVETPQGFLEPQLSYFQGKKTLVLDLDETLVHSTFEPIRNPDLVLPVRIQGGTYRINVMVRPGAEEFLARVGEMFEVVVFTASLAEYAEPLVKMLDKTNAVSYLLYRQHCSPLNGIYVKDLSLIGRDLRNVILVDNSPNSFLFQPENAYHITNFFDDKTDRELLKLEAFLEKIANVDDVRPIEEFRRRFEPSTQPGMKLVKIKHEEIDFDNSSIHVVEPMKPFVDNKKEDVKEKACIVETEPDLRKSDRNGKFNKSHSSEKKKSKAKVYSDQSKVSALTERIVVNDRFLPDPLDSSVEIELPSPKESDKLIYQREGDQESNSNSTADSRENRNTKTKGTRKGKLSVPPFSKNALSIITNLAQKDAHFVAVDDPTLEGHHVEEVRFHTGIDNLNSPLGKHVKIELGNHMNNDSSN